MPAYQTTPFKQPPVLLVAGTPQYLYGGYNDKTGPTLGYVISDSGNGTTSTVIFQIQSGNVPVVGALVTIVGTANSAGAYNVTNASITSVTVTEQGVCTIQFAGGGTSASAQDFGAVQIPQPETSEVIVTGSSVPAAMPYNNTTYNLNQALTAVCSFPSLPTTAVVNLQQAVQDIDSEYSLVAVVATVTGGAVTAAGSQITVDPTLGRFFRFNVSGLTGAGTIIAKLLM